MWQSLDSNPVFWVSTVTFANFSKILLEKNCVYLSLAILGVHCCTGFSLVVARGPTLWLMCTDFPLRWFLLLQSMGSGALGLE